MTEHFHSRRGSLRAEAVTPDHIGDLEVMIGQQASHHLCNYANDGARLTAEITSADPVLNSFIVYGEDEPDRPLGYAAYMMYWTFDGKALYLEDLCTDVSVRQGGGVGRFAFNEVRRIAEDAECHSVKWAAMASNAGALRFYQKQGAHDPGKYYYDMDNLLTATVGPDSDYAAERITDSAPFLPKALQGVTEDPRAALFSVTDKAGEVKALILANENYSTFRGVTGLHVEPVKFIDENATDTQKTSMLRTAFAAVSSYAQAEGLTGHLCAYAKKDCDASNDFLTATGNGRAKMNDDPDSVFVCMAVNLGQRPAAPL
jgi:hypothetical protein